jgi:ribosomal protein S18 acetylase RimI-like enzyme
MAFSRVGSIRFDCKELHSNAPQFPMNHMTQRSSTATQSDIPLLVELMTEFYGESNYPLDKEWAANSFATLIDRSELGSVWLLRHDGQPAGHLVMTIRFSMEYGAAEAYIDDLFVRSPYRRQGVASEGLSLMLDECRRRKVRALQVEVGVDNIAAQRTYAKFGLALRRDRRQVLTLGLR